MKKSTFALALALASTGAQSATLDIISLTVTGGDFSWSVPGAGACSTDPADFASFKCLTGGNNSPILMGQYQAASLTAFNWFGAPMQTFTAASAAGAVNNPTGVPNGTVDTDAGSMTIDFGAWYAGWGGTIFLLGTDPSTNAGRTSAAATGTYNPLTHEFDISWHSYISPEKNGAFGEETGYWHLTGTAEVSAVPVPAAVWLFGSGLLGLLGITRKRNTQSV